MRKSNLVAALQRHIHTYGPYIIRLWQVDNRMCYLLEVAPVATLRGYRYRENIRGKLNNWGTHLSKISMLCRTPPMQVLQGIPVETLSNMIWSFWIIIQLKKSPLLHKKLYNNPRQKIPVLCYLCILERIKFQIVMLFLNLKPLLTMFLLHFT